MPNLNHKGPENLGPKTGNKLGKCRKTKSDFIESTENINCGKGRRRKSNCNKVNRLDYEKNCHTNN